MDEFTKVKNVDKKRRGPRSESRATPAYIFSIRSWEMRKLMPHMSSNS